MQQLTFDFYNEPLPGASDSHGAPQETLATYRGKVYHLTLSGNEDDPSACDGCEGYGSGDFCIETEYACIGNNGLIWKEKT